MKKIELKEVPITNTQAADVKLNYRTEFLQAVEVVEEGLTVSEMGIAVKVADKLRTAKSHILLEDAEHQWLGMRMQRRKFSVVCVELIEMVDSLSNAPDVTVDEIEE